MAGKRGTRGSYACIVPEGGRRSGCGKGNKVAELETLFKKIGKEQVRQAKVLKKQEVAIEKQAKAVEGMKADRSALEREYEDRVRRSKAAAAARAESMKAKSAPARKKKARK